MAHMQFNDGCPKSWGCFPFRLPTPRAVAIASPYSKILSLLSETCRTEEISMVLEVPDCDHVSYLTLNPKRVWCGGCIVARKKHEIAMGT